MIIRQAGTVVGAISLKFQHLMIDSILKLFDLTAGLQLFCCSFRTLLAYGSLYGHMQQSSGTTKLTRRNSKKANIWLASSSHSAVLLMDDFRDMAVPRIAAQLKLMEQKFATLSCISVSLDSL